MDLNAFPTSLPAAPEATFIAVRTPTVSSKLIPAVFAIDEAFKSASARSCVVMALLSAV